MTIPINLIVCCLMGVCVAAVGHASTPQDLRQRRVAALALALLQILVFAPTTAYIHWRFAQWSTMYLVDVARVPLPVAAVSIVYPIVAFAAFDAGWRLCERRPRFVTVSMVLLGLALVVAFVAGHQRLCWVGSTEAFRNGQALTPVTRTPVPYLHAVFLPCIVACFTVTLWRLHLLGALRPKRHHRATDTTHRTDDENAGTTAPHVAVSDAQTDQADTRPTIPAPSPPIM